jgi:hypothetical protein
MEDELHMHVSCTTPFVELGNSLIGVGHIKFGMFEYLNRKILECYNLSRENGNIFEHDNAKKFFDNVTAYFQGKSVGRVKGVRDHLMNVVFELIEWATANIYNNPRHGINGDKQYIQKVTPRLINGTSWKQYTFLDDQYDAARQYCEHKNFIQRVDGDSWSCIRNLHPTVQYFMLFYKFNKHTLELESFSHPFMLIKNTDTSFLNFTMGITTNQISEDKKEIWLSYGEGDCACHLASFEEEKFNELVGKNTNDTATTNVEYWLYKDDDLSRH